MHYLAMFVYFYLSVTAILLMLGFLLGCVRYRKIDDIATFANEILIVAISWPLAVVDIIKYFK